MKQTSKGNLWIEFAVHRIQEGQDEEGVEQYLYDLKKLVRLGANLYNPESVKSSIPRAQ